MAKYVKGYSKFIESRIFEVDDNTLFDDIFNNLLNNDSIDESIREEIKSFMIIHEGFFDKLKSRFPKAAEVSNLLSDKAEQMLGSLIQKAKDVVSFVKKIVDGIREFFLKMLEEGKKMFNEQIKQGKFKAKIDELTHTKKEGLTSDIKVMKQVIEWYRKDFLGNLVSSTEKNMTEFTTNEQEPIAESFNINEGKNVISTLIHGLESIPPFSWLHEVSKAGEAGASSLINSISSITSKFGGPAFQLPVIALLIGVVIEQLVKSQAAHWLLDIVGAATPLGLAIKGIKILALFIALVVALDGVIGGKVLDHDSHDSHDSKNDKKEIKDEPKEVQSEQSKEDSPDEIS